MPFKQFFPMWGGSCCLRLIEIKTRRATIHQIHLPDFIIPLRGVEAFRKFGTFAQACLSQITARAVSTQN